MGSRPGERKGRKEDQEKLAALQSWLNLQGTLKLAWPLRVALSGTEGVGPKID